MKAKEEKELKTYGDVIKEIAEIIYYSNDLKRECPKDEIHNNFSKKLGLDIANEYYHEFCDLLATEMVFYRMKSVPNYSNNNSNLLLLCEQKGNNTDFLKLRNILKSVEKKVPEALTELMGYFVLKKDLPEFTRLCLKLKVGPYQRVNEDLDQLHKFAVKKGTDVNDQFERIKINIRKLLNNTDILSAFNSILSAAEESKFEEKKGQTSMQATATTVETPTREDESVTYIHGKHKALVYLGISGKLTIDMISQVRVVLSQNEFNELLAELEKYGVFTHKQIEEIIKLSVSSPRYINGIDEFIACMILKDDLNLKALKEVVTKLYGYENYHYFMDKLYQYGKISFEEYKPSLDELISNQREK